MSSQMKPEIKTTQNCKSAVLTKILNSSVINKHKRDFVSLGHAATEAKNSKIFTLCLAALHSRLGVIGYVRVVREHIAVLGYLFRRFYLHHIDGEHDRKARLQQHSQKCLINWKFQQNASKIRGMHFRIQFTIPICGMMEVLNL